MGWFDDQGIEGYTGGTPTASPTYAYSPSSPAMTATGAAQGAVAGMNAPLPPGYGPEVSPSGPGGPQVSPGGGYGNTSIPQYSNSTGNSAAYAGLDPRLAALYQQYGVTPGGAGSGIDDASYWNNKITSGGDAGYYLGRLQSDLAGNGPDTGGGSASSSFSAVSAPNVTLPNIQAGVNVPAAVDYQLPTQGAPTTYTPFSYGSFSAPTGQDVQNEPGYAFGLDQGTKALQANQALQGVLKSGGAAKALDQYATDYASTKYNDAYQRSLNTFNTNAGLAFQTNQANNAGNLNTFQANTNANLAYGNAAAQRAQMLNQYSLSSAGLGLQGQIANQNYALGGANLNLGYYSAANQYNLGMAGIGLGYYNAGNQNQLNQQYYGLAAQNQDFNQGYTLSNMGMGAAESLNNAGAQYGANTTNLITGSGNAGAAGIVGAGNAWNGGIGQAANTGMNAYGQYAFGNWPKSQPAPQQPAPYYGMSSGPSGYMGGG